MDTSRLYEKIELIKTTIANVNNEKSEQWIQRQNLQDLYHQLILGDIDFTIDKKLEQDLWNNVFKSQINFFQTQIKDKKNTKRIESQANLYFFLENARGFYTKLLQDIIFKFNLNVDFCKNFQFLRSANDLNSAEQKDEGYGKLKEKQIMYLCQHILTHLGDIARYEQQYEQAKTYYLHAIKLVPYLGHPYNQIGILYETTRIQQLSTVFYYIRSIAVKYTFPLAATNLENFFHKLIDIPISRYSTNTTTNGKTELIIKDFIQLYLQINAFLYLSATTTSTQTQLLNKIQVYLDLFYKQLTLINKKPGNFDLTQFICILIFMMNKFTPNEQQSQILLQMFTTLNETLLQVYLQADDETTANEQSATNWLSPLYFGFLYFESLDSNEIFLHSQFKNATAFWEIICKVLNKLQIKCGNYQQKHAIDPITTDMMLTDSFYKTYSDYPLNEEMCLDCFLPIKDYLKDLNFKKYTSKSLKLSGRNEAFLKKLRLCDLFERCIKKYDALSGTYMRLVIGQDQVYQFTTAQQQQQKKRRQNVAIMTMQQQQLQQQQSDVSPTSIKQPPISRPQAISQVTSPSNVANMAGFPSFLPTDQSNYVAPLKSQIPPTINRPVGPAMQQQQKPNQYNQPVFMDNNGTPQQSAQFSVFPSFFDAKTTQHNEFSINQFNTPVQNIWSSSLTPQSHTLASASSSSKTTTTTSSTQINQATRTFSNSDYSPFNLDFSSTSITPTTNTYRLWHSPITTAESQQQRTSTTQAAAVSNLNLSQTIWAFNAPATPSKLEQINNKKNPS